jgi:hypothetical protein
MVLPSHPAHSAGLSLAAALAASLLAAPALAQAQVPPLPPGDTTAPRFSFAPVEGGALKLDRETGRVSLCAKRGTGFTCEAVPDTRDAYEAEIARLQGEVDSLRRSAQLPPLPPLPPTPGPNASPDTSDMDRALDYAERFYKRLRGLIDEFRAPNGQEKL